MRASLAGRTVRDVGYPFGVGCRGYEVSLQLVLCPRLRNTGSPPPPTLLLRDTLYVIVLDIQLTHAAHQIPGVLSR